MSPFLDQDSNSQDEVRAKAQANAEDEALDQSEAEAEDQEIDEELDSASEKFNPNPPVNLQQSIERLDTLILESVEDEKIRAGLGIRMALGMAQELKYGLPLGTETGELVQGWVITYGQENVDAAVAIARQFLIKPADMRKALGQRLGLEDEV